MTLMEAQELHQMSLAAFSRDHLVISELVQVKYPILCNIDLHRRYHHLALDQVRHRDAAHLAQALNRIDQLGLLSELRRRKGFKLR